MKNRHYILLFVFAFVLSSCFEEDQHINPIPIEQFTVPYSLYEYQVYYNIANQEVVSYNNYADWDLGFESRKDGYHIILNSSKYMYAGNTFETNFTSVVSNTASKMYFDHSSGNLDSTVFANWADYSDPLNPVFNNNVYVIDRGKSETGASFGFKKVVIEKMENDTFYVHIANLDNTEDFFSKIPKDSTRNFTLFSLDAGGQTLVSEPEKGSWDLCFTKYSTIIPDNNGVPTDYIVRGALLNPYKGIEVALDTVSYFYSITSDLMNQYNYSKNSDAIGYDWKVFRDDIYIIRDNNSYILRNVDGLNYKIRFTGFYNNMGAKGYPSFEQMELLTL